VNILDENILKDERQLLQGWRIAIHQIGYDVGRKGMQDEEIIPFLHQLSRPTFFTRDEDFYERTLCHARYCLVYLNVEQYEVAVFVRRVLRHWNFDTQAKRMGSVIRASHVGLTVWHLHAEQETRFEWAR
jgi:hypothetical protein